MTGALMLSGDHYFAGTSPAFKLLRLLNLMEPDRTVVSLSKLTLWVGLIGMVVVLITMPDQWAAIFGASTVQAAATGNYMWRRKHAATSNLPS